MVTDEKSLCLCQAYIQNTINDSLKCQVETINAIKALSAKALNAMKALNAIKALNVIKALTP
uniref:Uncharacterized protein n=1 Tax=Romanomermis culicivorax TaxID=13658 RepID=A0A915HFU5_ROMCU